MQAYSHYRLLKVEMEDGVALLTLNRPENLNAVDQALHKEIENVFLDLNADAEVRAVVVTGAGRAFSAGGDIEMMLNRVEEGYYTTANIKREIRRASRLVRNILDLEVPLIAAVNGPAIGFGATLALFSDVIIAGESARIGHTQVGFGAVAAHGAVIWPLLVGIHRAKLYLMNGDILSAREAERVGLVTMVVPDNQLMETAMGLARRLASGPTLAISWTKMAVNKIVKDVYNSVADSALAWELHTFRSKDHEEAARAFLAKRKAKFQGI